MEKEIITIEIINNIDNSTITIDYVEVDGSEAKVITEIANANGFNCELLSYYELFITSKPKVEVTDKKIETLISEINKVVKTLA